MKHLRDAELVDLIEGRGGAEQARHAESCPACRAEVASLSVLLEAAQLDVVPEPSPIFWDQQSARISEAIDADFAAQRRRWLTAAAPWRLAAAAAAVVLAAVLTWSAFSVLDSDGPSPHQPDQAAAPAGEADEAEGFVDAWDALEAAAQDLGWEEAQAIGIGSRPGASEPLVDDLTDDERLELARLIKEEMRRHGA
jgi:hypothetical protein